MSHADKAREGPQFGETREHRGCVVTMTLHGFDIRRDGKHLGWAPSFEGADKAIDSLLLTRELA